MTTHHPHAKPQASKAPQTGGMGFAPMGMYTGPKVSAQVQSITRAEAQRLLDNMGTNRARRETRVAEIAGAMQAGRFDSLNGETVIVDERGRLIDGQHRLAAFLLTGAASMQFLVVTGVAAESWDTIDQGALRTHGDIFRMHGESNANVLAAAARWQWLYIHDYPAGIATRSNAGIDRRTLLETLNEYPGLRDAAVETNTIYSHAGRAMIHSVATFVRFNTWRISAPNSDRFFQCLETGDGDLSTKTVRAFRDKLLARRSRSQRLLAPDILVMAARVWNAYRKGQALAKLFVGRDLAAPYANAPRFQ